MNGSHGKNQSHSIGGAADRDRAFRSGTGDYIQQQGPRLQQLEALESCIASYQELWNWTRHVEITPKAYDATLDIYHFASGLKKRFADDQVCEMPPEV